ncbi:MAG TPA: ABC transporter ATP-binding protein [Gemmatimonadaceae bacterium]|nr:ABC transporter ATP-binding protein [Gemmatimonadaceae bacterium]
MHRTEHRMDRTEPAVSVTSLTRAFGDLTALDALSFDVAAGELFGIVGPDGSGKTTTLRILAGVLRPTSGDATVVGTSVAKDPEGVKHRIAYMSQRFGLYTDLSVRENIEFYADLYGVPRKARAKRLERLYAFSQLGQFENRLAGALSGGMKQKLSLCCALIHEPEVLLLDEPTFGVDPISRRELWLIVHEMVANGMTAIVSTAYLDEAERCDRVALLNKGKLAALDTPAELQGRLRGRTLAIDSDSPRQAMELMRAQAGVRSAAMFGQSLHLTLESQGHESELRALLERGGIAVRSMHELEPSLEDVFIDLSTTDHVN